MSAAILIVEDDARNMKLIRELLRITGYQTLEAENGEEGVSKARSNTPALILMDMQMPVMDGLEAVRILKSDAGTREIPIIALTALAMKGDEERAYAAGCDGYISKPVRIKELQKLVASYIGEAGVQSSVDTAAPSE